MEQALDLLEQVILVDEDNQQTGISAKLECHERGLLHRAFSIFLFTPDGRTLVQRRAHSKYHSGGKWANTCCGHPRPGEDISKAAHRRLGEEFGVSADLIEGFHARYEAPVNDTMVENEYVHVFVGKSVETPRPNPAEICEFAYQHFDDMQLGGAIPPESQAPWLQHYLRQHTGQLREGALKALHLS